MKKILFLTMLMILLFTGCGGSSSQQSSTQSSAQQSSQSSTQSSSQLSSRQEIFAMDTYMTLTGYGENCEEAVSAAIEEIERLDELLSVGKENSEISAINTNGNGKVSEDTEIMLKESLSLYETTEGAFDITVYPLMEAWGFTSDDFHVPESGEIEAILKTVDSSAIKYDPASKTIELDDGQGVDFGGIAKGYASGRVMEIFEQYDLTSGMVSLGGNVHCYSTKTDGSLWRVGIVKPDSVESDTDILGVVSVKDKAVITSGGYERFFEDEETGKTYHHILDPETGYPAESGLISVTIVSENGMLADGLSTSLFIMGLEKAENYWQQYGDTFEMILMDENGTVYITEGLKQNFSTEFPLSVIRRE
ncbi:MAG: FAD:protein FMN transferase [Lachnospiraceae bacterium]|nr:FAD:protein FMN transferase [Lachnospiraceae bacterium]